jgi:hypothetical protein
MMLGVFRGGGRTWPVELGELHRGLARAGVADNDTATDAEVPVPPRLVQGAGVLGHAELDVAVGVGLLARGLEAGGEGVNVAGNHGDTIAGFVALGDGEGDDGAAVARGEVLAAGLELVGPVVAAGELSRDGLAKAVACMHLRRCM